MKLTLITLSAIFGVGLIIFMMIFSTQNKAISIEENVKTALSDIDVHLTKRYNKLSELAECVKQYDTHEYKTLTDVIGSRGKQMSGGEVKQALMSIAAVAENYPNLKANENYKTLMVEVSLEENHLGQSRKAYNEFIRDYNRYVRSFPTRIFLDITNYEVVKFERFETEAHTKDTKPLKLF